MLYDTHAHTNFAAFKENYKELIQNTLDQGVWLNNVGTQKDTSASAVAVANEFEQGVYAVVGLHPIHTLKQHVDEEESSFNTREEKFDHDYYLTLVQNKKVVGIGECGLDYYRIPGDMSTKEVKEIQETIFKEQIRLAKEIGKALVIHCRPSPETQDAYEDILAILEAEKPERFEIHSFTSNWQICEKFLNLGGYIGLNGIVTFDKTGILKEVIQNCPLEKMLLETDAPYLAPPPFRGKQNEPSYVKYVCEFLAGTKNLPIETVAEQTTANARQLFQV